MTSFFKQVSRYITQLYYSSVQLYKNHREKIKFGYSSIKINNLFAEPGELQFVEEFYVENNFTSFDENNKYMKSLSRACFTLMGSLRGNRFTLMGSSGVNRFTLIGSSGSNYFTLMGLSGGNHFTLA